MTMKLKFAALSLTSVLVLAACGGGGAPAPVDPVDPQPTTGTLSFTPRAGQTFVVLNAQGEVVAQADPDPTTPEVVIPDLAPGDFTVVFRDAGLNTFATESSTTVMAGQDAAVVVPAMAAGTADAFPGSEGAFAVPTTVVTGNATEITLFLKNDTTGAVEAFQAVQQLPIPAVNKINLGTPTAFVQPIGNTDPALRTAVTGVTVDPQTGVVMAPEGTIAAGQELVVVAPFTPTVAGNFCTILPNLDPRMEAPTEPHAVCVDATAQ